MISGINSTLNFKNEETVKNISPQASDAKSKIENITFSNDMFVPAVEKESIKEQSNNNPETISEIKSEKGIETPKKNSFKEFAAKVSKFFVTSEEVTKGIGKGTLYGGLIGALGLGLSWFTSALPKGFKRGTKFTEPFMHPVKSMNKTHKIVTATLAGSVFVHQIVKAVLKSNQRKANIDHKLNIKHD